MRIRRFYCVLQGVFRTNNWNFSIISCTVILLIVITFSAGNGIVYSEEPESTVTRNDGHQMVTADSYAPHGPILISSNADFSSQGWPGNGNLTHPYIIEGLNITADAVCINITDTTAYFEVRDCVISSGVVSSFDGIFLENVTYGTIRNCIINLHYHGLTILESSSCTFTNNTASSNSDYGYYLDNSTSCILTNNSATSNADTGFYLFSSNGCTLTNNAATNNLRDGYYLGYSDSCNLTENSANSNLRDGFHLAHLDNCTMIHNTVYRSGVCGFGLEKSKNCTLTHNTGANSMIGFALDTSNCTLTHNTASDNRGYGFHLMTECENNTLYLNRIGSNVVSDAQDDGVLNYWDDGISQGNYWLDYEGTGTYSISGTAGSVDNYPFFWDIVVPTVNSPSNVEYTEGESGNSITWIPSDDYPKSYTVYRNSEVIISGAWNSSTESITISVDELSSWVYNYTLVVTDAGGNTAIDTVLVTVLDITAPSVDSPADIQYNEFNTGYVITWHPSDLHPCSYVIYMDSNPVSSGAWNSSSESITVSVDGLGLGTCIYTLVVTDASGNTVIDTVLVTVLEVTTTTTTTTTPETSDIMLILVLAGAGIAVVVIVIIVILKKRTA